MAHGLIASTDDVLLLKRADIALPLMHIGVPIDSSDQQRDLALATQSCHYPLDAS